MIRSIPAAALLGLAFTGSVSADNGAGEGEDGRFLFKHVEDGFVRLDTRSGQVALCSRHNVGWVCQPVPEERAALEAEIDRLQTENAALKKELLTHGIDLPGVAKRLPDIAKPEKPAPRGGGLADHDTNLDRVMGLLGRAWQRLVEMVTTLQSRG